MNNLRIKKGIELNKNNRLIVISLIILTLVPLYFILEYNINKPNVPNNSTNLNQVSTSTYINFTSNKWVPISNSSDKLKMFIIDYNEYDNGYIAANVTLNYNSTKKVVLAEVSGSIQLSFDGIVKKHEVFSIQSYNANSTTLGMLTITEQEIINWDNETYQRHQLTYKIISNSTFWINYENNYIKINKITNYTEDLLVTRAGPIIVNSTIILTSSFDGGGKTYIHGPSLGDYPLFKLIGTGVTLSNVIIDDNSEGFSNGAVVISGVGNSIKYCTLKNCKRYGFTASNANKFYIGYNTILQAQYGVSGSSGGGNSGWGIDGVIEHNNISGMLNCGIKCKAFMNVTIRNNYINLTPTITTISPIGIHFSDDAPNIGVIVYDNEIIRVEEGVGGTTYGLHADGGPNIANPEIISTNNLIRDNKFTNCTYGAYLLGNAVGSLYTHDFTLIYNTFTNCSNGSGTIYNKGVNNVIENNTVDGIIIK